MLNKILLSIFILFFSGCLLSLKGQDNSADFVLPDVVPLSPEAQGIGKFGDVPVSTYTGTPNISIPIYTVKAGKLSLPITLSYHASGIEVSQEATWVGLGWNLVAGGSISYIPVGGNDLSTSTTVSSSDFQEILDYYKSDYLPDEVPNVGHEDWFAGWGCTGSKWEMYEVTNVPLENREPQIIDDERIAFLLKGLGEPDVYSANFAGYSFKFIKHPITKTYFIKGQDNKCKIEEIPYTLTSHGFLITGEDGIMYRFESTETSPSITGPSSWLLTMIISPTGDTITLKYKEVETLSLPSLSETYVVKENEESNRIISSAMTNYVHYLDTIETSNELVVFKSAGGRVDLVGAESLTEISVEDKNNQVEKFSYHFNYGYFTGDLIGGDYLDDDLYNPNTTFSIERKSKRLKLESLVRQSNNMENENYAFSYYETEPLPYKTSFAFDHWGYYNGQENNSSLIDDKKHTIIPNALPLIICNPNALALFLWNPFDHPSIDNTFYTLNGAIRGASENIDTASAGMLKSIQYPTKGKTVFMYEPHDYFNYKYFSAEDEIANQGFISTSFKRVQAFDTSFPAIATNTLDTFIILNTETNVTFRGYIDDPNGVVKILNSSNNIVRIYSGQSGPSSNGHAAEWDEEIWLQPGNYKLICTEPPIWLNSGNKMPLIVGEVVYNYGYYSSVNSINGIGGGLRVKKVVNYDENDIVVSSKRYSYAYPNGNSSGKLLIPLNNFDVRNIRISIYNPQSGVTIGEVTSVERTAYTLYGRSCVSLSGFSSGNNVGYDRVEVESYNSNNKTNGKEITYYSNSPGQLYYGKIPYFQNEVNGDLLERVLLDANGNTVLKEKNYYSICPGTETSEILNAYAEDLYEGPTSECPLPNYNPLAYIGRYNIYIYPTRNYFNTLTSKETTQYFDNGELTTTTNYTYNIKNYNVKSITETTSKGAKYTTIKYPVDYTDNIHTGMVNKNQINSPVETVTWENEDSKFKVTTNYALWYGSFYAPQKITSTKGSESVPDDRVIYDLYDEHGNVEQCHKNDDVTISYVWGYNGSLPVAKIVNASYSGTNIHYTGNMFLGLQQFESSTLYNLTGSCSFTENVEATITRSYNKPPFYGATYTVWIYNNNNEIVTSFYDGLTLTETSKTFSSQLSLPAGQYTAKAAISFTDIPSGVTDFPGQINVSVNGINYRDAGAPYYNGFEEDEANISTTYSRTGDKSHTGSFAFTMPTISGQSILSYWKKQDAGSPWIEVKQIITASGQNITLGSTGTYIDEVRIYPAGSLMTTYTYDPVYGITSQTDPNGKTTYYEYDYFGRLKRTRDNDGNMLQEYEYHYAE